MSLSCVYFSSSPSKFFISLSAFSTSVFSSFYSSFQYSSRSAVAFLDVSSIRSLHFLRNTSFCRLTLGLSGIIRPFGRCTRKDKCLKTRHENPPSTWILSI